MSVESTSALSVFFQRPLKSYKLAAFFAFSNLEIFCIPTYEIHRLYQIIYFVTINQE